MTDEIVEVANTAVVATDEAAKVADVVDPQNPLLSPEAKVIHEVAARLTEARDLVYTAAAASEAASNVTLKAATTLQEVPNNERDMRQEIAKFELAAKAARLDVTRIIGEARATLINLAHRIP